MLQRAWVKANRVGETGVADYRLYYIRNGHFYRFEEISAEDDEAAIAEALRREPGISAELWNGARKVTTFEPEAASAKAR
jgi:hypothetical protein